MSTAPERIWLWQMNGESWEGNYSGPPSPKFKIDAAEYIRIDIPDGIIKNLGSARDDLEKQWRATRVENERLNARIAELQNALRLLVDLGERNIEHLCDNDRSTVDLCGRFKKK